MLTTLLTEDQVLLRDYLKGNENALEVLIHRHKKSVFQYINKIVKDQQLAKDIFQDTFFKVVSKLKKGQYNEEGKFLPWVLRIAHNLSIDHFREKAKMSTISQVKDRDGEMMDIFDVIKIKEVSHEDKIMKKQMGKQIRNLVGRLPFEQREVLMMRHYYDMSFIEISDQTNVSINTALGRMRYALINLRKMMEKENISVAV